MAHVGILHRSCVINLIHALTVADVFEAKANNIEFIWSVFCNPVVFLLHFCLA